jgi:hypothetical protein
MANEPVPEEEPNTPETLGVTPRYVLQHNAISRSAHGLSATAKKITALAMALLPPDLSSRTAAFTFADFCRAVGFDKGGESFRVFLAALKESGQADIYLEIMNPNGKKTWEGFPWFSHWKFEETTGVATLTFSQELVDVLLELRRVYAKINLKDIGKLQSRYAIRLFELAKSYESLKGKDGNKAGTWYFERTIEDLRFMFGVPEDAYKETRDFTKKVIKEPVEELNAADVGVTITPLPVKEGRKTTGYRLSCEEEARTVGKKAPARKRGRKKVAAAKEEAPELPAANPRAEKTRDGKELEHLAELYPDEFIQYYKEALEARPAFMKDTKLYMRFLREQALLKLREKHGIVK